MRPRENLDQGEAVARGAGETGTLLGGRSARAGRAGERIGDVAGTTGAVACLASSRAYARGVTSTAGGGGAGVTTLARLGDGVLGSLRDGRVDTFASIFSDAGGGKTRGAGAEIGADSSIGEGGLGVASDARLKLALLAVAEPPGVIAESRLRGPPAFRLRVLTGDRRGIFVGDFGVAGTPLVPTPPSPGTTIFFAGEPTAFSPSSTENGRFRFVRPGDLGVKEGANGVVNP